MSDIDRDAIRKQKAICGGCGSPLREVGPLEGDRRGEAFECSKDAAATRNTGCTAMGITRRWSKSAETSP